MTGKIIKGIAGFYYVRAEDAVWECRARGLFRKENLKPLPGDLAEIEVLSEADHTGTVLSVYPRRNALVRPEAANVDQILLLFSATRPEPNYEMLNRYLVSVHDAGADVCLIVTKSETAGPETQEEIRKQFLNTGYGIFFVSAHRDVGKAEMLRLLGGKTSVLAGPSGAGKSTFLNWLSGEDRMETGELSRKIDRGRNTTRHTEMFCLPGDTFLLDTPGFTAVEVPEILPENLVLYFDEFIPYSTSCRFSSCRHLKEKGCCVRKAVADGLVSMSRYRTYRSLYEEMEARRPRG
ncbi:MAG: ribosome small subunit-dependent GTPase A [Lachnospiraceae bacterium]|nr:ribosome small subunit-dependent GTPase A [Lachnospiraceae bacterium]